MVEQLRDAFPTHDETISCVEQNDVNGKAIYKIRNNILSFSIQWSGRLDSNQRPLDPQSSALSQTALRPDV